MYPAIISTDLHLTDSAQDEYRWSIFDEIEEQRRKYKAKTLLLLGDTTDSKDRHPATLVNRVVDALASTGMRVVILQGNHDYLLLGHPFFGFLSKIDGITFVTQPTRIGDWVFLPHSRKTPLPGLSLVDGTVTHCFMHQTFSGAMTSNGQEMEGELSTGDLPHTRTCTYYSGDIHVPQKLGHVEYVGSPYPVHFGDTYKPRFIVMKDAEETVNVRWRGIRRETVSVVSADKLDALDLKQGDQLKVRLSLSRSQATEWHEHKEAVQRWCDRLGLRLVGIELKLPPVRRQLITGDRGPAQDVAPMSVLSRYANGRDLDDRVLEVGMGIIKKVVRREA